MTTTQKAEGYVGRVKTVLVFGYGKDARAVISTVVVQKRTDDRKVRIRFFGPAELHKKSKRHINKILLPVVDNILKGVGVTDYNIGLSVVNLEAAAVMDTEIMIKGFSADASFIIAMLSVGLEMKVPEDIACTGHLASLHGEILPVRSLLAKLDAVVESGNIRVFIYPEIDQEKSLSRLSPESSQQAHRNIITSERHVRMVAVRDVAELIKKVFPPEEIARASFRFGFYRSAAPVSKASDPVSRAIVFLMAENDSRFWGALENRFFEGNMSKVAGLLSEFTDYFVRQHEYPKGVGLNLMRLINSIPTTMRRLKMKSPLISEPLFFKLCQYAKNNDYEDIQLFFRAVFGEKDRTLSNFTDADKRSRGATVEIQSSTLQLIAVELSSSNLAKKIGEPIDAARLSFNLAPVIVEDSSELMQIVTSFYSQLLRRTHRLMGSYQPEDIQKEALAILEQAFKRDGGIYGAISESMNGPKGGVRFLLDEMTNEFKRQETEKYINMVIKTVLDPMDFDAKVEFIKEFMELFDIYLPPNIRAQPPERFAVKCEELIRVFLGSKEKIEQVFRTQ